MPFDLAGPSLVAAVLAALVIGISKTGISGLGALSAAVFALVLPTRESTAAVLLLLIVADVVAIAIYRRDANWRLLRHLLPAIIPGLLVGALILNFSDNTLLRRWIGALFIVSVVIQLVVAWRRADQDLAAAPAMHPAISWLTGGAAGVATMTANAAGPIVTVYLIASRVDKRQFLGTMAWFTFIGNLLKVPLSFGVGLMGPGTFALALLLAPAVLIGTWLGARLVKRINQQWFNRVVLGTSLIAAIALLVS
ncbi:sulfite exporter TauE/SafE family protein [Propionibacteriaceae bacterium Y1685]